MLHNGEPEAAPRPIRVNINLADLFLPAMHQLPSFTGKNMSVAKFARELNEKATALSFDKDRLARILPLQLTGVAKAKYNGYAAETKKNYQLCMQQLKKDFSGKNYGEIAKSKLSKLHQGLDENVVEFAERVRDLVEEAYGTANEDIFNEIATENFIRGVKTSFRVGLRMKRKVNGTFNEMIEMAEIFQEKEEIRKREESSFVDPIVSTVTSVLESLGFGSENVALPENNQNWNSPNYRHREFKARNSSYHDRSYYDYQNLENISCPNGRQQYEFSRYQNNDFGYNRDNYGSYYEGNNQHDNDNEYCFDNEDNGSYNDDYAVRNESYSNGSQYQDNQNEGFYEYNNGHDRHDSIHQTDGFDYADGNNYENNQNNCDYYQNEVNMIADLRENELESFPDQN